MNKTGFYILIITSYCLFSFCHSSKEKDSETDGKSLTYNDIAPLIYRNCSPCHRPGAGAPFDLITFDDVKRHLHTVRLSVNEHQMPPWPADTAYSHFRDEKVMTQSEIVALNQWINNGAPEGDPTKLPVAPMYVGGSRFGKPDLVLKLLKPYLIKGDNTDNFIMLKIPIQLKADTFIRAIEIVPGNKKLVHHVNAHLIQYAVGAKKNLYQGAEFVNTELHDKREAYSLLDLQNDDGSYPILTPSVTNFLPGVEVAIYPKGIGGYRIKKNATLLLDNMHYGPSPIDTSDQTTFNVFFSPVPPLRPVSEFIVGTSGISKVEPPLVIPPGNIKKFTSSYRLAESISLLTVNPHMHLLGSSFKAYAVSPENDTIHLINIPKWDFRWQYFYTFSKPIVLKSGTTIVSEGVYDNTENNPLNPFHPPQQVSEQNGSMRTTDEMFQLICTYIPYQNGDELIQLDDEKIR